MVRKWSMALWALGMALLLALPAEAAGRGIVRVKLDAGDLAVTNGEVTLYYVGAPSQEGYLLTEDYGGGMVKREDAMSSHLAQWLRQSAGEGGVPRLLDADGQATFTGLEDGLYLLVQTKSMDGFYPIQPMLVPLPCQEARDILIAPTLRPIVVSESPATGQVFSPLIAAMVMVLSGVGLYWCADRRRKE